MANEITLAETLNMIKKLKTEKEDITFEVEDTSDGIKVKNEPIATMTVNRLLYFISTTQQMRDDIIDIMEEAEMIEDKEIALEVSFHEYSNTALLAMRRLVVLRVKRDKLKMQIDALEQHCDTFEMEDHKRIRKTESLDLLKLLKIIK